MRFLFGLLVCGAVLAQTPGVCAQSSSLPSGAQAPAASQTSGAEVQVDPLVEQVEEAIQITSRRYLTANVHTPWQIMHGVLALRQNFMIKDGEEKISALEWMTRGQMHDGSHWFQVTEYGGRSHPFTKAYAFEGHPNQFLAILSMSDLPPDFEFQADRGKITIGDMVEHAKMDVNSREEITWTLWALSHYLPSDARWTNKYGEPWSIERLVQIQTYADVNGAACGGTHGLFALSHARNNYIHTGQPLRGVWMEADQKIRRYIETARSYQNSDGSFSNSFFQGRSYANDFNTRIASSGHTLEFLMMALPQSRLEEQWVRQAVSATARDLIEHRSVSAKCGPLYHALNGLVIYVQRVKPEPEPVTATEPADENAAEPADGTSASEAAAESVAADSDNAAPADDTVADTETATESSSVEVTDEAGKD